MCWGLRITSEPRSEVKVVMDSDRTPELIRFVKFMSTLVGALICFGYPLFNCPLMWFALFPGAVILQLYLELGIIIYISRCSKLLSHWSPVQKFVQFYNSCSEHPVKCNMFKVSRSASVRYERRSPFPGLCTSCLLVLCTIVFIAVHVMFTYVFLCRRRFLTWNLFLRIMVMRRSSIAIWFILHPRVGNTLMITFWLSSFKGFYARTMGRGAQRTLKISPGFLGMHSLLYKQVISSKQHFSEFLCAFL